MDDKVKIAIDAMGGEKSPTKIINGIEISLKSNNENFIWIMILLYFMNFSSFSFIARILKT